MGLFSVLVIMNLKCANGNNSSIVLTQSPLIVPVPRGFYYKIGLGLFSDKPPLTNMRAPQCISDELSDDVRNQDWKDVSCRTLYEKS